MQPENNNANTTTTPQGDASTAMDAALKAPSQETPAQENMMAQGTAVGKNAGEKKSKGMVLGMIILVILAVGGIGFGVWAMMDGNSQKEQLNSQISTLKQQNSELMDQMSATTGSTEENTVININTDANVDASSYIYISEWGKKIKISDSLEVVTYSYDYGDGDTVLKVSGATKDGQSIPDFARVSKCALGAVERYSKTNVEAGVVPDWYGEPFMTDDSYNYYYNSPQALCTNVQGNAQWETSTVDAIKSMLSTPTNYSAI